MSNSGNGIMWGAVAVWLFAVLLGLGFTGTVIWAIIKLVNHYT